MRRTGRAAWVVTLAILAVGSPGLGADDPPKSDPKAAEAVDRVLAEWQAKASAISSVEVRFRMTERARGPSDTRRVGRAILAAPNLALLETSPIGANGKSTGLGERLIWNGRSILQFDGNEHKVSRFPIRDEWPEAPSPLRLPFFFRMTVDGAKRDYDWTLVEEARDRVILRASLKAGPASDFGTVESVIVLDRRTFLPRRLISRDRDGRGRQDYEIIEIKVNTFDDLDALREPCLDAWTVEEKGGWLTRLFLK